MRATVRGVKKAAIAIGAFSAAVGAFAAFHLEEVPKSKRTRFMLFKDDAWVRDVAESTWQRLLLDEAKSILPEDHVASTYVREVGEKIAAASGVDPASCTFHVVDKPAVRAHVLPGGHVVVYGGLIKTLKDEDQLAAALAHDWGHVLCQHPQERLSFMLTVLVPLGLVSYLASRETSVKVAAWVYRRLLFNLPMPVPKEEEADAEALLLLARAKFTPLALNEMTRRMTAADLSGSHNYGIAWPALHISTIYRTHKVDRAIAPVMQEYLVATGQDAGAGKR